MVSTMLWFLGLTLVVLESTLVICDPSCGQTPIPPSFSIVYIVNGHEAKPHSIPWQLSLQEKRYGINTGHGCGASIISADWALTAAHCIDRYGPQKYTVVAGLHSLAIRDPKQHSYKVKKVHIHPGWEEGYEHDIALLELETPVQFNEHVQPVCLPDADQEWVEPGTLFVVTGWGNLKESGGKPDKLQQLVLPLFDYKACGQLPQYRGAVGEKVLCAGYPEGGKDACSGDSGGPLVAKVNGVWVQAGIVSWGEGCARPNSPGIYTHIAKYRQWMDAIMKA